MPLTVTQNPVGQSLRNGRFRQNMSQEEVVIEFDQLCDELGLTERLGTKETLSKIERGARFVRGVELLVLCHILKLDPWNIDPRITSLKSTR